MKQKLLSLLCCLTLIASLTGTAVAAGQQVVGELEQAPKSYLTQTPYLTQCELGCVVADALRQSTGAQIALVNVGDLVNDLNQGEVTWEDVSNVFAQDKTLAVAEVTGEQLFALLNHGVSSIQVDDHTEQIVEGTEVFDGFCQVSGFAFRYDASAPVGERIVSVTLEDGTAVEEGTTLTLAATEDMLSGAYGFPALEHESRTQSMTQALAEYLAGHTRLPQRETDRITIIGARQNPIVGMFPRGAMVGSLVLLMAFLVVTGLRAKRYQEEK
jgi:5'-nucleotidase